MTITTITTTERDQFDICLVRLSFHSAPRDVQPYLPSMQVSLEFLADVTWIFEVREASSDAVDGKGRGWYKEGT